MTFRGVPFLLIFSQIPFVLDNNTAYRKTGGTIEKLHFLNILYYVYWDAGFHSLPRV